MEKTNEQVIKENESYLVTRAKIKKGIELERQMAEKLYSIRKEGYSVLKPVMSFEDSPAYEELLKIQAESEYLKQIGSIELEEMQNNEAIKRLEEQIVKAQKGEL